MKKAINNFWNGIVGIVLLTMLTSCLPESIEDQPILDDGVSTLVASPTFEWATTKSVEIKVNGLGLPVDISRRLTLKTADGDIFYANSHNIKDDLTLRFSLPNHVSQIKMVYGTLEKTQEIQNLKVVFDYGVEVDNSDID
ncbi:MAG TPA: hypothetical protein VK957_02540 [Lunatimonas sp.]|nr:hypothetical protein [Lunatimonas sp.]